MQLRNLVLVGLAACVPQQQQSAVSPYQGSSEPAPAQTPTVTETESTVASPSGPVEATGTATAMPMAGGVSSGDRTMLLMGLRQTGVGRSYTMNVGWYVLFEDGRVLAQMPADGLEGIDERAWAAHLGTYAVNDNTLEMAFQNYRLVFVPRKDGGFDSREGSFWPASSLDGAALEGTFGPTAGRPEIAFTRDGQFQTNGGLMINTGGNGLAPTPAGVGVYRIARNTLTLAYSTGQVVRISASTLKANEMPSPSSIYFGGFEYRRF